MTVIRKFTTTAIQPVMYFPSQGLFFAARIMPYTATITARVRAAGGSDSVKVPMITSREKIISFVL
jgi:hypothetical protein